MTGIGIDIGRVIIGPTIGGVEDTSFIGTQLQEALTTPAAPGAFEVIRGLVERFEGRAWLVSKCGPSVERKTKAWLEHVDFYALTGLASDNVRFCRERREKAGHCEELGITHFIDDRLDVLSPMRGGVPNLFLFGEREGAASRWTIPVVDWRAVAGWFER